MKVLQKQVFDNYSYSTIIRVLQLGNIIVYRYVVTIMAVGCCY